MKYLAGVGDLCARASIADAAVLRVGKSLEDIWKIGIETPLTDVEGLKVGISIEDVLRIGAAHPLFFSFGA